MHWRAFCDAMCVCRMEEGQYLITHKPEEPFVTLLKAADGKACRSAYDLRQVHNGLPRTPTHGPVPWIPVDPTVALPFHKKHGRVPCTFPPRSAPQVKNSITLTFNAYEHTKESQELNRWNALGQALLSLVEPVPMPPAISAERTSRTKDSLAVRTTPLSTVD